MVNLEIKPDSIFIPIIVPKEFHSERYFSAMLLTTLTLKPIDFSFRNKDFYVRNLDYNTKEIINETDFSGSTTEYSFIYY